MARLKTKAELEAENRWLWFYHFNIHEETDIAFFEQYDTKGNLIARCSTRFPKSKDRPVLPDVATDD